MNTNRLTTKPIYEVLAAIQSLDLESVKARVTDPRLGEGWTREYADSIEIAFKHYLSMIVKYQEHAEDILLSEDVDEFWHTYILQTMKYSDDCEAVFGAYLHHSPHVGEVTEADHEKRDALAEKTRALYQREFGSAAETAWAGQIDKADAAMSNVAIRPAEAAMSNVAIRANNAAMSNMAFRAENAAMSNVAIRAGNAAMSNVAIRAGNAAMSNATIRADNAAMSNVAARVQSGATLSSAVTA